MDLAPYIEHTALAAETGPAEIEQLCGEAAEHNFVAVCVNPYFVAQASAQLSSSPTRVVSVVGFPLGACSFASTAREAADAIDAGAAEIDMVVPLGLALAAEFGEVGRCIEAVRTATRGSQLKVILETGYFDEIEISTLSSLAVNAGADYLKTSMGFGPRGATVRDVELLVSYCADRAKVKAAGGIRTAEVARSLVEAGATRLGTSKGVHLVTQTDQPAAD